MITATPFKTLANLRRQLVRAWTRDTSSDPSAWSPTNPAWGQCAVTALIVQDRLGGDLLRAKVEGISHYWNRLSDGTEVDLTWEQFGPGAAKQEIAERDRDYVLSFPDTVLRYEQLRRRLGSTS